MAGVLTLRLNFTVDLISFFKYFQFTHVRIVNRHETTVICAVNKNFIIYSLYVNNKYLCTIRVTEKNKTIGWTVCISFKMFKISLTG